MDADQVGGFPLAEPVGEPKSAQRAVTFGGRR
jgi:hypothetical protein